MSTDIRLPPKWIELNICKRECIVFIPSNEDTLVCQCGRFKPEHPSDHFQTQHFRPGDPWIPSVHTKVMPTDAYGTIIFEGEHHPNKSHFVRLSHDTNPEIVRQLMTLVWGLPMPKLLITVRGSNTNFDLQARLGRILQIGLVKAAKTTGAWIITNGLNRGVAKHVGTALGNQRTLGFKRGRIVSIGICPFGIVQNREVLIGHNKDRSYNPLEVSSSNYIILNPKHSNFLLVDNGTVGKLGGESVFRRRLEKCIGSYPTSPNRGCNCPIVCLVIGGSFNTLRNITDYLYDEPPVPVVVFAGTGITTDLIAMILRKVSATDKFILDEIREEVCEMMIKWYKINKAQCDVLYEEITKIVNRKNLITIFNASAPDSETLDTVLLTSLFRSQHWTPLQQLSLTLVWDRVDLATHEVFVYGRDWSRGRRWLEHCATIIPHRAQETLEHAMMEALSSNRLDFVELLIEHGLNMQIFLTPKRLEELYSLDRTSSIVMRTLLFELKIRTTKKRMVKGISQNLDKNLTLHDIGFVMSHMMGHVYKSRYSNFKKRKRSAAEEEAPAETAKTVMDFYFTQPFDDLFIWAILTKRHGMAVLLWKHGVGALAKALVAVRLNKYLVEEFKSAEKTETNLAAEFQGYAEEWEGFSYSLLDTCFKVDTSLARQLLTMELEHWSKLTCLTLAVTANHRMLLGHPCCQILLADLWMGALHHQHTTMVKVLAGILFPPFALCCDFKTRDELKLLPHQVKKEGQLNPNSDQQLLDNTSLQTFSKSKASIPSSVFLKRFDDEGSLEGGEGGRSGTELERKSAKKIGNSRRPHHIRHHHGSHQPPQTIFKRNHSPDHDVIIYDDAAKLQGSGHRVTIIDDITSSSEDSNEENEKQKHDVEHTKKEMEDPRMLSSYVTTHQELSLVRKLYEFQQAPMVNFYRHTIGYLIFLGCLAYVILVPQQVKKMGLVEIYAVSYLFTLGCDTIREFICVDGYSWSQKWNQFQTNNWSLTDFGIVCFSLVGTILRLYPTSERGFFNYGMLIYKVGGIYWYLRLYKYLSNHRWVGPKLVMITRMLKHMIYFAMILLVVMIAFGISREAIRFPDMYPTWKRVSEAFLEPYVMFYGEIDVDALTPQCGDPDLGQKECPVGHWIIPITWAIYMMVANILIVNVLIAVFNGIYAEVDAIAIELWMFQRFTFVMEFQSKPLLPPPFIIFCHLFYVLRLGYFKWRSCVCDEELEEESLDIEQEGRRVYIGGTDRSLKTFPTSTEATRAFDFEEDNLETIDTHSSRAEISTKKSFETEGPRRVPAKGEYPGHFGGSFDQNEKNVSELIQKISNMSTEMENQKAKLDRILAYLDDEEQEPVTTAGKLTSFSTAKFRTE